ncbi:MAG: dihydropteroate synthase [Bradymonadia bacterium]
MRWRTPLGTFEWPGPVILMGVINTTPDSFSDGGLHLDARRAIEAGLSMVEQGAQILDVGGESSRPGAEPVSVEQELSRVIPVIEGLRAHTSVSISIDTCKAAVARQAVDAGADIINDITALCDPEMASVAAESGAGLVLMHMRGNPQTMQSGDLSADDITALAMNRLKAAMARAEGAGVSPEAICLDPGIGFGKTVPQNLQLITGLPRWAELERPVLMGVSRKSFIGALTDQPVEARQWGTAAAVACCVSEGAHVVRVHDVAEMRDVVRIAKAIAETRTNAL